MIDEARRTEAVGAFAELLDLPPIARLTQRGRDPLTARYTLVLADGRELRVGTIKALWSQTEFHQVCAVSLGTVPISLDQPTWRKAIRAMVNFATDVTETPGENLEDTVADWIGRYAGRAGSDRDGAAASGEPFIDEGRLHINASDFARFIRREYTEQIKLTELRQALADLGYERRAINYVRANGKMSKRSSTSYYRAPGTEGDAE